VVGALGGFGFPGPVLVQFALMYVLLGGLTFALSALLRTDWLIAILFMFLQTLLHGLVSAGAEIGGFTRAVERILPPFHLAQAAGVSGYPGGAALAHVLLYGAGLVAIGLAVLRYRPLGSGGRS